MQQADFKEVLLSSTTNCHIEGTRSFGPNAIQSELVSGQKRCSVTGAYIPPSEEDGKMTDFIQEAAASSRHPLILLGDFN